ncbi:uncharacterized protein LOC100845068 [Brachypodium distachyon]|uniref:Bidirectional sugar transporter SWEET n=1 Tax=Brachypodium distachyon TaxID=15368 RepID=I1HI05_BRADI|nr:uncharacterized protein LOC100845068 [Brachypodium distachyon]KQK05572.1 hypothetical protein BRADI_2g20940v3 [Brachypodium distachyon]|eukprot:XP_010231210.2 uncharacterized protein LOC100845068 [Brachypodium distachyon]
MASDAAEYLFFALGSIATLVCCTPYKPISAIRQTGEPGREDPFVYMIVLASCLVWLVYCAATSNCLLFAINVAAMIFQCYYLDVFMLVYTEDFARYVFGVFTLVIEMALFIFFCPLTVATDDAKKMVWGAVGVSCSGFMYLVASMEITELYKAGKVRDAYRATVAWLFSGVFRAIYARIRGEVMLEISNWIGIGFAVIQVVEYVWLYYKGNGRHED